ncbi:MAG: hypothetical protein OXQ94_02250 [Gemmatimonadota bacterium]|nr:hypothetical protein [Gemmatimonadota bacterium]
MNGHSEEARIRLTYEGPAVYRGRMPAADVGKAILGMATTVTRAGKVLHGEEGRIEATIEPRFVRGSFEIQFVFDIPGMLMGVGFLALVFDRLFYRLRRDVARQTLGDPDRASELARLEADLRVRKAIADIVRPLDQDTATLLTIRDESDDPAFAPLSIGYDDAPLFGAGVKTLDRYETQDVFTIIKPSFRPRTVWRLARDSDGREFSAYVNDMDFISSMVERKIGFRSGDRLVARLRTTVKSRFGQTSELNEIVRVYDHLTSG